MVTKYCVDAYLKWFLFVAQIIVMLYTPSSYHLSNAKSMQSIQHIYRCNSIHSQNAKFPENVILVYKVRIRVLSRTVYQLF